MILYHGSPFLFDRFDLSAAGEGTGLKFGFGVYLTEVKTSAIHYSQPRHLPPMPEHYLYTVEIPDLTDDNHLTSALPVVPVIVERVETKLGVCAPEKVKAHGKDFRKWVGTTLTGAPRAGFAEEKAAAELLNSLGVLYNVWPTAQSKPDGSRNIAVFDARNVRIIGRERIEVERRHGVFPFIREYYPQYIGLQSYPAEECVAFCKTHEEWGILSNMAATPIIIDGVEFKSAEHIFQMMKFNDPEYVMKVWSGITRDGKKCYDIKKTAKSYEPDHRRADWGSMIVDALKYALQQKYNQCEAFRNELERSKGKIIVEQQANPRKPADTWSAKLYGDKWIGSNLTGRLLMELRDNGKLEYNLHSDALMFVCIIQNCVNIHKKL